jgi:L-lactate dehydrogenase complex protein LldG
MSEARDAILGTIRSALAGAGPDRLEAGALEHRLAEHRRNLEPARSDLDPGARVDLFIAEAERVDATVARVPSTADVPAAIAGYLANNNLPARLKVAPSADLEAIPWTAATTLEVATGAADPTDAVGVASAFAGVAETGTLVLRSGPDSPTTINFLPDTEVVVVPASRIVGTYEDAWTGLRAEGALPRSVNLITGPSRTGDIELTLLLGAHGPRRLFIVVVDDEQAT